MAMYQLLAILAVVATLCPLNTAHLIYQTRIPNAGNRSADPMVPSMIPSPFGVANQFCESVGHVAKCDGSPSGGGNVFGMAFKTAGYTYTAALCMADSDGDNYTNGMELGDPDCVWMVGATTNRTANLSHPGFSCSTPIDPFCLAGKSAVTSMPTTAPPSMATSMTGNMTVSDMTVGNMTEAGPTNSGQASLGAAMILLLPAAMLLFIQSLS